MLSIKYLTMLNIKYLTMLSIKYLTMLSLKNLSMLIINNSRTLRAKTPMARLPWLIQTRFRVPMDVLPIASENRYLRKVSYFIM